MEMKGEMVREQQKHSTDQGEAVSNKENQFNIGGEKQSSLKYFEKTSQKRGQNVSISFLKQFLNDPVNCHRLSVDALPGAEQREKFDERCSVQCAVSNQKNQEFKKPRKFFKRKFHVEKT